MRTAAWNAGSFAIKASVANADKIAGMHTLAVFMTPDQHSCMPLIYRYQIASFPPPAEYLPASQLFLVMTGGFASVAGSVLGAYISFG